MEDNQCSRLWHASRRRRIYFLGYHRKTQIYKRINKEKANWIMKNGPIASALPIVGQDPTSCAHFKLAGDLFDTSDSFNQNGKLSPFLNTGLMMRGNVYTFKSKPAYSGQYMTLGMSRFKGKIPKEFFINNESKEKWEELKGAKKLERKSKGGHIYNYSEGAMAFPDALNKPSRTIMTGEGGNSPSRFKHVIDTPEGLRRLVPIELERLNMFPRRSH